MLRRTDHFQMLCLDVPITQMWKCDVFPLVTFRMWWTRSTDEVRMKLHVQANITYVRHRSHWSSEQPIMNISSGLYERPLTVKLGCGCVVVRCESDIQRNDVSDITSNHEVTSPSYVRWTSIRVITASICEARLLCMSQPIRWKWNTTVMRAQLIMWSLDVSCTFLCCRKKSWLMCGGLIKT